MEVDTIFTSFRKDERNIYKIKRVVNVLKSGDNGMFVKMLEIPENKNNCQSSANFVDACCDATEYSACFSLGSIFRDGLVALEGYEDGKLPIEKEARKALRKLLTYLNSSAVEDLRRPDSCDECAWAVQVAQHLLSELTVRGEYTIDRHYTKSTLPNMGDEYLCPCEKGDKMAGTFGDTSFGCLEAWHGSADIWVENIPVTVVAESAEGSVEDGLPSDSSDDRCNVSSVEVRSSDGFSTTDKWQMLAQCIVSSFLQKKQCDGMTNYLTPSLGISRSNVVAHFYDCENDVLFSSYPVDLFNREDKPSIYAVVLLWLTLNYKWFCSGATRKMKTHRANFFVCAGDLLDVYRCDVQRPAHKVPSNTREMLDDFPELDLDPDAEPKITLTDMTSVLQSLSPDHSDSQLGLDSDGDVGQYRTDGTTSCGSKRPAPHADSGSTVPKRSHPEDDAPI